MSIQGELLYEVYNELNGMDSEQIRADFEALYQAMHGMSLKEMPSSTLSAPVAAITSAPGSSRE